MQHTAGSSSTIILTSCQGEGLRALEIELRCPLSFWDALILHAAESAGCEVLYSEELSHGEEYNGVLLINS